MEFYTKKYKSLSVVLLCLVGAMLSFGNIWPKEEQLIGNLIVLLFLFTAILSIHKHGIYNITMGMFFPLILLSFYLFSSIAWNKPSVNMNGIVYLNNMGWWMDYSKMCMVSLIVGIFCVTYNQRITLLFAFSGCAFLFPIAFTVYSIYLDGEARYGEIHNIFTNSFMNSSGIIMLIVLLPLLYASFIFFNPQKINYLKIVYLIFLYSVATVVSFLYKSRSVVIIMYLISPFLIGLCCHKKFSSSFYNKKYILFSILAIITFIILNFFPRAINLETIKNLRFTAFLSFLDNLFIYPLSYAKVPISFEIVTLNHYFHNFFADAHRLSGFWSFLSAVLLVGYIGIRVLQAAIKAPEGRMLLMVFIPVFLILNTSVVPEGEFQPILLILLLGGCAESILREERVQRDLENMPDKLLG